MAAPCGCGNNGVLIEGENPICVERTGARPITYLVKFCEDFCQTVLDCVRARLGLGLVYDEATGEIQAQLSNDAGNTLHFGADGGLKNLSGVEPVPGICGQTIADLPPAPQTVAGAALAGLINPYSSPEGVQYCLANNVDIISFQVACSSDDVGVVADYWSCRITTGRSSIYISQDIRQLSSHTCQSVFNYAGDVDNPQFFNPGDGADIDRGDRRGGWYGWLARNYSQPLAIEFLSAIDSKAIALMTCHMDPDLPAGSVGSEESNVRAALRAGMEYCAQNWTMIGVRELPNATTVVNAGFTPVMMPLDPQLWATPDLPYPVAELTAAGVQWIILSHMYTDAVFQAYQAAGINVLMKGTSRHVDRARITALGIRGGYMLDPVYYRGSPWGEGYGYRSEYDPWEHRRMGTGQLTARTDQYEVIGENGVQDGWVRGRTTAAAQGLILPAGFGSGYVRPSVLCGWECPITDPTDYTITWDMQWNTLAGASATTAKMGLLFGAETDASPYAWPANAEVNPRGFPEGQQTLYRVTQRQNGQILIGKWASQTAGFTELAAATSPAIAADVWNTYTLRVQGDQITFTRTMAGGQEVSVTASDTQYRGPYFWVEKEERTQGQTDNGFEGAFRNVTYSEGAA